jgi:protein-tyrosine phosphatase
MIIARTSISHPIRVDELPLSNGMLGLTFCPGKKGSSLSGAPWDRDIDADLALLRTWGAGLVITLMERREFDLLCVPNLTERIAAHEMDWTHLPIADQGVPSAAFFKVWPQIRADAVARLKRGERVILHCRGGLGRTGLVAALFLMEAGLKFQNAIKMVRQVRSGAIETTEQELFVQQYLAKNHC